MNLKIYYIPLRHTIRHPVNCEIKTHKEGMYAFNNQKENVLILRNKNTGKLIKFKVKSVNDLVFILRKYKEWSIAKN